MMAITTSNSTSVKPRVDRGGFAISCGVSRKVLATMQEAARLQKDDGAV
jgi:hypothetical protein